MDLEIGCAQMVIVLDGAERQLTTRSALFLLPDTHWRPQIAENGALFTPTL